MPRAVFKYFVPVYVEVYDGLVTAVTVDDTVPVTDPEFVEGDRDYFEQAIQDAENGQAWPAWEWV